MLPEAEDSTDKPLRNWRQGDYVRGVNWFVFLDLDESGEYVTKHTQCSDVVGLVAISQTCDIVRRTQNRDYVAVCPLIKVTENISDEVRRGRRPYMVRIENTDEDIVVDLRRVMSVQKNIVRTWERSEGFNSRYGSVQFAAALERKFGQFAFPDEFDEAIACFKKRVWSRHNRQSSPLGAIYRSLAQIRIRADPDWSADCKEITFIVIMKDKLEQNVTRQNINKELNTSFGKIEWPRGYDWSSQRFVLHTAGDLTAEDIISSNRGDFDFLCY